MSSLEKFGSASIQQPNYWWYRARSHLLDAALSPHLRAATHSTGRLLDVGSADGPSVDWMGTADFTRITIDLDPRGLQPGQGISASALQLPFRDGTFDVVGAFDVIEHCDPEPTALAELRRVLRPGGLLLASVPAYEWAWTEHDRYAGHYRRYTRPRLTHSVQAAGFRVTRATYAFAGVFPMFAADRLLRRVRQERQPAPLEGTERPPLPQVSPFTDRVLTGLSATEATLLRKHDLPFGSSVFLAALRT